MINDQLRSLECGVTYFLCDGVADFWYFQFLTLYGNVCYKTKDIDV